MGQTTFLREGEDESVHCLAYNTIGHGTQGKLSCWENKIILFIGKPGVRVHAWLELPLPLFFLL